MCVVCNVHYFWIASIALSHSSALSATGSEYDPQSRHSKERQRMVLVKSLVWQKRGTSLDSLLYPCGDDFHQERGVKGDYS